MPFVFAAGSVAGDPGESLARSRRDDWPARPDHGVRRPATGAGPLGAREPVDENFAAVWRAGHRLLGGAAVPRTDAREPAADDARGRPDFVRHFICRLARGDAPAQVGHGLKPNGGQASAADGFFNLQNQNPSSS